MQLGKSILASLCLGMIVQQSLQQPAMAGQWSAGPVAIVQASPYIGGESGFLLVPAVAYEGEKLKVRGPFVDYFLIDEGREGFAFALTFALGSNELEVDNDPILAGIDDRDSGLLAGVRAEHPFMKGRASLSLQTDITNKSQGQRATVAWSRPFFSPNPRKFIFTAGIELSWESKDYADYYYGISNQESLNSIYNEYKVDSVVQPSLTFGGYYNFTEKWQVIYNLELQMLSSDVKDSPIVDQSSVASGVVGVVYNF
jgi:outer membrane protein